MLGDGMRGTIEALALLGACGLGAVGCGSASSSGAGGAALDGGRDAGSHDAASETDVQLYEAGAGDTSTPDAGEGDADAGPACAIAPTLSPSSACNACVEDYCDPAWCTCAQDTAYVDAGVNGCERYVACVSQCVQTDAGLPTTCAQSLCAHTPYTSEEQQEGQALLNCVVLHCSMDCPL